ncbi:MAG: hypothetical protein IKP28_04590 [Clostridia bacterium]|nr:hypothetical protein [Clostridia bacterium]
MKKFVCMMALLLMLMMTVSACAELEVVKEYVTEDDIHVILWQDPDNYADQAITLEDTFEFGVSLTIHGRPELSAELLELLQYFRLGEDAFSGIDNRLDYGRILWIYGLEEGNI